ncbi:hypothetical protein GQ42DRAFT_87301 [Ramicandelaber brevisporus]|nr:hypothetical protein GQ42DRAFT_87301 [Ramicandelaber brevisporus]
MQYKYRHMASLILQLRFKSTRQVANGTVALRSSSAAAHFRGGLAARQLDVVHVVCANRLESGNIPTVERAVQLAAALFILGGEHRASPRLRRWSEVHHHSAEHLRPAVCLLLARSGLVRRRRPRDDLVHAVDDGQDAGKVAVAGCHCCRRGGSTAGADLLRHRQHHVHVEAPAQIGARRHRRHRSPRHIVVSRRRPAAPRRRKCCVEQP